MKDALGHLLEQTLSPREVHVLQLRFGLTDGRPRTLLEVGECMEPSVTRERVRQVQEQALRKMRTSSTRYQMSDYIDALEAE